MDIIQFYIIYLPALEKALEINNLKGQANDPEYYIDNQYLSQVNYYLDYNYNQNLFLDKVAYFFDAINHNFPNIQGVDINIYRENLFKEISRIKLIYDIR